jgi:hypothetical protein
MLSPEYARSIAREYEARPALIHACYRDFMLARVRGYEAGVKSHLSDAIECFVKVRG